MTDFEMFKAMMDRRGEAHQYLGESLNVKYQVTDYGTNVAITFIVKAGVGGSSDGLVDAFFRKKDGQFIGFCHCD